MKAKGKVLVLFGKPHEVKVVDLEGHLGLYSRDDLTVTVRSKLKQEVLESTLLHEVLEAICSELELKIHHRDLCRLEVELYANLRANGVSFEPLARGIAR